MKKGISTRMRNIMHSYIGKSYDVYFSGHYYWTLKITGFLGDTGYFTTEINDGTKVWESNASYGEIKAETGKGTYRESQEVKQS
jgi:hypothetical protein